MEAVFHDIAADPRIIASVLCGSVVEGGHKGILSLWLATASEAEAVQQEYAPALGVLLAHDIELSLRARNAEGGPGWFLFQPMRTVSGDPDAVPV